jgi:hypothetical protein
MPSMKSSEVLLRCAQERDRLTLSLRGAPVPKQVEAYKEVEKELLNEARSQDEVREIQRRITEDLLVATRCGPWRVFAPHLRRIERLGYSSIDRRALACVMAAQASRGSPTGVRRTATLIKDIERRVARSNRLHPRLREEIQGALARARVFAGLPPKNRKAQEGKARS